MSITPGASGWEEDLRYQCRVYQNVLLQQPQTDEAELMARAESILLEEKFQRQPDPSKKLFSNNLRAYRKVG